MEGKIKKIANEEDFKKVYKVFSGPPYNEKYTDDELNEIYSEYCDNGYVYGVYQDDECVGLVALERGTKNSHPVRYSVDEKIMYLADVAVLDEYRRKGLGNQLMIYAVMQAKSLGYDKLYMRTLERGSMSYNIALRIGFEKIPGIFQNVERERVNGIVESMSNIFLEIDLNSLDKEKIAKEISLMAITEREGGAEK